MEAEKCYINSVIDAETYDCCGKMPSHVPSKCQNNFRKSIELFELGIISMLVVDEH